MRKFRRVKVQYLTEIYRAIRFLYLINNSFASKGDNYGYGATKRPNQQIFLKDSLTKLQERLSNTYVENLSFEKIIDKYDRKDSVFFCDPPYFETSKYEYEFNEEDHLLLLNRLKRIKGKFILTINDHEKVREWYKSFNIKEVKVAYSVSRETTGRRKFKELIITNYKN